VRLAYDIAGAGPLIVFLHGVGGNRSNWNGELDGRLAREFCCVAWDARGYGASDDPDRPLVFEHFGDDLAALLDHLGAERAHLVGLSMGGHIAQSFCLSRPGRVATLTLASSSAGASLLTSVEREEFLAIRLRPLENGKTMRDIAPGLVDVLAGSRAGPEVRERLRASMEALRPEPYKAALRALVTTDFRSQLDRITVPTLVVVGSDDRVLPEELSRYLAAHIRGSRFERFIGAGHLCNIEAPEEFAAALADFLAPHAQRASRMGAALGA
jgi:pimeloyl-ACP methyl ester carboxylesterase